MDDREASDWLRPGVVRARLLDELGRLPPDEHLEALEAVERRDVEIILTERSTITISVAERWRVTIAVGDIVIATDEVAGADG